MMTDIVFLACCIPVLLAISVARPEEAGEVAVKSLLNILWLGLKEIRSLMSDVVMVVFVVYAFTLAIYIQATGTSSEVNNASIAFVDEDGSALSKELFNAFYPPRFKLPETDRRRRGRRTRWTGAASCSSSSIPPRFEHDLRAGRNPAIQVNIDATAMQQAGIGAGYIKNIINDRVASFLKRTDVTAPQARSTWSSASCSTRTRVSSWFKSVVAIINQITPADGRADGRRGDPRARARHARAPAGDAADRVRDRDGEGVGQQPGDPGRDRRLRCSWSCRWR